MKKICTFCEKEIEYEKHQQWAAHRSNCKFNPNRDRKIEKIKASSRLIKRKSTLKEFKINCPKCNKEKIIFITEVRFKSGKFSKFCSRKCANSHISTNEQNHETKEIKCKICYKDEIVNKRVSDKSYVCKSCRIQIPYQKLKEAFPNKRIKNTTYCKYCGAVFNNCKRIEICRKSRIIPALIKYFGFDNSVIGTENYYLEYERIKLNLENDYYHLLMSLNDIMIKYNYNSMNHRNFSKILNSLKIKRRSLSEAGSNAYLTGNNSPRSAVQYKHGWFKTWDDKNVYLRSSYEFDFANKLNIMKIKYEVEKIRILYWDSQKLKFRVAIPDFYLPDTNTIIEIKSNYTLDIQTMKDRVKAFEEHGFNFKLILEYKEVEI